MLFQDLYDLFKANGRYPLTSATWFSILYHKRAVSQALSDPAAYTAGTFPCPAPSAGQENEYARSSARSFLPGRMRFARKL
jgi:hypothetical protein